MGAGDMKALIAAIYFASVVAANAQFYSGNEFNTFCKKKDVLVYAYAFLSSFALR
jgi:hypothetical protein